MCVSYSLEKGCLGDDFPFGAKGLFEGRDVSFMALNHSLFTIYTINFWMISAILGYIQNSSFEKKKRVDAPGDSGGSSKISILWALPKPLENKCIHKDE